MSCFNPNNESFKEAINSKIYIDKTGLLEYMNDVLCTEQKCIAVSHARRFGKSQAARMIDAYYSKGSDSRELFSKFEISKSLDFEKYLNKYNVIHIDMAQMCDNCGGDFMGRLLESLIDDISEEFGDKLDYSKPIDRIINNIYKLTGSKFVIIIDEWDCIVRNYADKQEKVHEYMQFLHSLFKSEDAKNFLALGYITGILPIKKIQDESALNNFREYTMIDCGELTQYFGFTEDEVKELCEKYDMGFKSVKAWYNGYLISGRHMYNPNSVCEAMYRRILDSFWKNTSSFDTLNSYILRNYEGLRDDIISIVGGGKVRVNVSTFRNDLSDIRSKDEVFTALIHLGYLGYDAKTKKVYLPNHEVGVAYQSALLDKEKWGKVSELLNVSEDLLDATIAKDEEQVAEILNEAHSTFVPVKYYNNEESLRSVVVMAYYAAQDYYAVVHELPTGKGYADLALLPLKDTDKPPLVIELKYDKTADSAIKQIKEKRYTKALKNFVNDCNGAEILLVGINYDKDSDDKKHTCVIESFVTEQE